MIVTPEQMKAEACQAEVNAALAKYGFKLDPFVILKMTGMTLGVNFVPVAASTPTLIKGGKADG